MSDRKDVIIVGAGPVGLTLANLLGQFGVSTVVFEGRDELIDYPRAVGIDDEALRTMQTIGLVDKVLPHTVPDQKIRIVNGDRKVLAEINPTTREFGWPRRNGFIQPLVDEALLEGLARYPHVEVRFGCRVEAFESASDGVTATVSTPTGEERVTGSYVVGCDGGRSLTRQHLGLAFEGETRSTRGLVIDVANDPIGTPHAVFGGDPSRGYATLSLPHGIRRWEFTLFEGESEEVAEDDAFVFSLLAPHVPDPASLDIIRRRVYAHHARVAEKFRVGRFLLAGDAAHVMPVVAGQGWNSGIRDALNLGWKLAAVVQGKANDSLLDSYEDERREHVKAMVALSLNMANLVTDHNRLRTAVRDIAAAVVDRLPKARARLNSQGYKPMPKYDHGVVVPSALPAWKSLPDREDAPRAVGTLFPQPTVQNENGQSVLLDDATGQGWRVVVWNNDPLAFIAEVEVEKLTGLGGVMVHAVPASQLPWAKAAAAPGVRVVGDESGVLKSWFDERSFSAIVVRPDHVVAAECLAQELNGVLKQVFSAAAVTLEPQNA
ncbi:MULTISPECIES: bifunctional 3-(3-hydroxy-phenyl)propionate/3-hydroxycinnamic acid hydroxylase [unclassified Arthrobacter]|uniref:bifunctional 3-(3-hydroxy-phenyl)propionate/3-hydroxycinnamic acid hydroxylase n=1 Tax=unclassified Arthrobacter TaxID=235627 RepID=UPI001C842AD1|nr:bifunctional 3-(3-hydroxy-phenyl)propionate/3-hydroxycinnamic acid hydroxylase [Arthrobacter sp. MAHUQ-56]MBX7444395.1 bifunctional 3-(3-hydroxy-phenyl)propionate/3-hydroxycinnamic acid hydroxylase [Arthrobacter sp. MAHUQ-56]